MIDSDVDGRKVFGHATGSRRIHHRRWKANYYKELRVLLALPDYIYAGTYINHTGTMEESTGAFGVAVANHIAAVRFGGFLQREADFV